jgi:hypothetical protein
MLASTSLLAAVFLFLKAVETRVSEQGQGLESSACISSEWDYSNKLTCHRVCVLYGRRYL